MLCRQVRVEGCAVGIDLVEKDALRLRRIGTDVELQAARFPLAAGRGVGDHLRAEFIELLRLDLEFDGNDVHGFSLQTGCFLRSSAT
jgi:hypothetical protein